MAPASPALPHVALRAVCANYCCLAMWMEAKEIQAEAALTALEAARTWKPALGTLSNYQASAVAKRLSTYVTTEASPMHHRQGHRAPPVVRASVEVLERQAAPCAGIEFKLDLTRAAREVRRILELHPVAKAVLLDERQPVDVAAELGLPAAHVYEVTAAAKRALRGSRKLRRLAEAICA